MCPNGFFPALQGVDVHRNGNFAKRKPPPLHGGEINARRGATLGVYSPRTRRGYVVGCIGRGYPHASINPLWYKGGVQGIIPCAGVGFRIGHAETHGPDAFRPHPSAEIRTSVSLEAPGHRWCGPAGISRMIAWTFVRNRAREYLPYSHGLINPNKQIP